MDGRLPDVFDMPFFLQTLSYNKYNLKPQTSEKQAKEILIRRQNTLRESMRKGHSLPWGTPVRRGLTQPPSRASLGDDLPYLNHKQNHYLAARERQT